MAVKERLADIGSQRARRILSETAQELHAARLQHGLSQAAVATATGISRSQVGRVERAEVPRVPVVILARMCAVVGLDLSVRVYPAGPPIRDAAHRALIERFRARVAPTVAWRFEVPIGRAGDPRAWDAVMLIGTAAVAVEAETRPRDMQALQRRVALKRRDDPGVSSVVLLLANTRHNRDLLREHGDAIRADFPAKGRDILGALAEGRTPEGSGIVPI